MCSALTPRKTAQQARAKVTLDAIIEAAARILEAQGLDGLTTNHIAATAGVSIGSLYQYFPNKEAVIAALVQREKATLLQDFLVVVTANLPADQAIVALIDATLAHQFTRPRLALTLEYIEPGLGMAADLRDTDVALIDLVTQIVRRVAPTAGPYAAQDLVAMCRAITNTAAMAGETDPEAIAPRLHLAVDGYLGISPETNRARIATALA